MCNTDAIAPTVIGMRLLYVTTLIFTIFLSCNSQTETSRDSELDASRVSPIAIVGVNVIPMDTERILANQTVLIRDGKIERISDKETLVIAEEYFQIQGRKRYLMPGLVDMHTHLFGETNSKHSLDLYLAHGITTIRNLSGESFHTELRDSVARGLISGPRIFTAGFYVNEPRVSSPEEAEEAVRLQKAAGFDYVKIHGNLNAETYHAVMQAARKYGIAIGGHIPRNLTAADALRERQGIDHLEEFLYTYPPIADSLFHYLGGEEPFPDDLALRLHNVVGQLAKNVAEADVPIVAMISAFELIKRQVSDEYFDLIAAPAFEYLSPLTRWDWGPEDNDYRDGFLGNERLLEMIDFGLELQLQMIKSFHESGVRLLCGSDAMNPISVPGEYLRREVELFVEAGMTPFEALRACTVLPTLALGIGNESGLLRENFRADLVLLATNPLEDIEALGAVDGVVVNGRWYSRMTLDQGLLRVKEFQSSKQAAFDTLRSILERNELDQAIDQYRKFDSSEPGLQRFMEKSFDERGVEFVHY